MKPNLQICIKIQHFVLKVFKKNILFEENCFSLNLFLIFSFKTYTTGYSWIRIWIQIQIGSNPGSGSRSKYNVFAIWIHNTDCYLPTLLFLKRRAMPLPLLLATGSAMKGSTFTTVAAAGRSVATIFSRFSCQLNKINVLYGIPQSKECKKKIN